jgi:hypothetical protein
VSVLFTLVTHGLLLICHGALNSVLTSIKPA